MRLRSGVTLITTLDPIRVAEDYAMVDAISDGRVDLVTGKGIYAEAFNLFGPTWDEAEEVYWERLDLLLRFLNETNVSWEGRFRTPIVDHTTEPRPVQDPLPVWLGLGRSMESPEGAAQRGLQLMMGNVLGDLGDAVPRLERYREAWLEEGRDPAKLRVAAVSHAYVARTSQEAKRRWEPYYRNYYTEMAKSAGALIKAPPFEFSERISRGAPAICGSPAEVAERILEMHEVWRHDEHFFQLDMGGLPWDLLVETIELLGSEVLPLLRAARVGA